VAIETPQHMQVVIQLNQGVKPDNEFCRKLEALIGHENYRLLKPHDRINKMV